MNEHNDIFQNYPGYFPCLEAIESDRNIFKNNNHSILFSFLIGYFSHKNINFNDLFSIINIYQGQNFDVNKLDFSGDFKRIAYIFCDYFEKKKKPNELINNNNINNINVINFNINNSDINLKNENNNIPLKSNTDVFLPNNNKNSQQFFGMYQSYNNPNNNNQILHNNKNNNNNTHLLNNNRNNAFINNINDINNNVYNNNIINNQNNVDLDFEFAKELERNEKEQIAKLQKEDEKKQVKKCEICLEEFSLLDFTNYFLNCNCIIHNVCFDNMVKAAIESNNLPLKCPNCKTPVHPNFIEDSLRNINPQLMEKYEHFSMNNFLLNNNDEYSSCPTPGCEYMFFFHPGEFNFLCPLCNKNYCLNCKDEWHRGMTCQQYKDSRDVSKLDNQFFQFVKGAKFKMCPRCKFWVEKNQGCNHMKCRCGADFCYLCGDFMDMSRAHKCKK